MTGLRECVCDGACVGDSVRGAAELDGYRQRLTSHESGNGHRASSVASSGIARRGWVWHVGRGRGTPATGGPDRSPRMADNAGLSGERALRQPIQRAVRSGRGRRPPLGDGHRRSRTTCGGHSGGDVPDRDRSEPSVPAARVGRHSRQAGHVDEWPLRVSAGSRRASKTDPHVRHRPSLAALTREYGCG
jgi:hypothetical protein